MNKATAILNGFKNVENPFQEIIKGVVSVERIDTQKFDVFSKKQVKDFLGGLVEVNMGKPLEIQKSVLFGARKEMSKLVSIVLSENTNKDTFYISPKGACPELIKAFAPVSDTKSYFKEPGDTDEEDLLAYISEHSEVTDEELVKEFGESVIDLLNKLHEENKITVTDEGHYIINDEETSNEDDDTDFEDDDNEEDFLEDEDGDKDSNEDDTDSLEGEDKEDIGDDKEDASEDDENFLEDDDTDSKEKEPIDEDSLEEEKTAPQEEEAPSQDEPQDEPQDDLPQEKNLNPYNPDGDQEEIPNEAPEEEIQEKSNKPSPEELEDFARKTATATLIKFLKNSSDEDLREVANLELERRGLDTTKYKDSNKETIENDPNIADTPDEINELKLWLNTYFTEMDSEDLIKYVSDLANQNVAKRKELKDHYRKSYQVENGGNTLMKVNEEDFKSWLEDKYFPGFSFGDLKDYALKLLALNPKEIKKMKISYEDIKNVSL